MAGLVGRKLLLIGIMVPLLNLIGFYYGSVYQRFAFPGARRDIPASRSYGEYLSDVVQGNLGQIAGVTVVEVVAEPLRNSIILLTAALAVTVVVGPLLGFLSISGRTRRITPVALLATTVGQSAPGFFLGIAALGAVIYHAFSRPGQGTLLPLSGFGLDAHLLLPIVVLATGPSLRVARVTAGLLEHELQQEYIRVAQGKGLGWRTVYWRHALPNVVSAVIVTLGQSARLLISALIIVETLFLWPGIGRVFLHTAGIRRDGRGPLAFFGAPELLAALAVIFGAWLLITDLVFSVLAQAADPRLARETDEPPRR